MSGLSMTSIYEGAKNGTFPKPFALTDGATRKPRDLDTQASA
jgi:predicted DNA-binding transcriptional regulator AlpA